MDCDLPSCINKCIITVFVVLGIYILLYVALYLYIAYISDKDYSVDLHRWKQQKLNNVR